MGPEPHLPFADTAESIDPEFNDFHADTPRPLAGTFRLRRLADRLQRQLAFVSWMGL